MPLEQVLKIVGDQTSSRLSVIYPLYSSGQSLVTLKKALRGEINPSENGWTNLLGRTQFRGGMGGPGGMFGAQVENPKQRVSLQFQGKDANFVALAFDRFTQTRVVPEDGTTALVSLTLKEATVPDAVAQVAKKVKRDWTKLYVLRGFGFGPGGGGLAGGGAGGPPQFATRGPAGADVAGPGNQRGPGRAEMTAEQIEAMNKQREEMRKQRDALEEDLKQTLPVEERQKLDQAQAERVKLMEELQTMTPEQRAQRFSQMGGAAGGNAAAMNKANRERLLNSTPEQRAKAGGPGGGMGRGGPGGGGGMGRGGPGGGGPGGAPQ